MLSQLLLVQRKELESRWWHRLANVLVFGSSILVFFFLFIVALFMDSWRQFDYVYSFEGDFEKSNGEIVNCSFNSYSYTGPSIYCGNITNSTDFFNRYTAARGTQDKLFEYRRRDEYQSDDVFMNAAIKDGKLSNIKAKRSSSVVYSRVLKNLGIIVLATFLWFTFLEAIIYRAIVYIISGKRKEHYG